MKIFVILAMFVVVLIALNTVVLYTTIEDVNIHITKTERITESDGDDGVTSKYLVYTKDEVFENTDAIMFFKFNSSDIYSKLNEGDSIKVEVAGWRVPFLSMYRNILKIKE